MSKAYSESGDRTAEVGGGEDEGEEEKKEQEQ